LRVRDVAGDKSPERLQVIVDSAPEAENYATDGYLSYVNLVYMGKHIRNIANKNDTFTVEGINADLRHYIPVLARRSRCFCRSLETLKAVIAVFVDAYNKFGEAKMGYRARLKLGKKSRELPFGLLILFSNVVVHIFTRNPLQSRYTYATMLNICICT